MISKLLVSYFSDFLSLFYPHLCIGCENVLPKGVEYLCPKCHYNLPKTHTHRLEVPQFREKFEGLVNVQDVLVFGHFHKKGLVQKLLHELKYGEMPAIGEMIGKRYAKDLFESGFENRYDVIVPVPLHPKRLKERGYNQSESFAKGLSDVLGGSLNTNHLVKRKHIQSQTKKTKVERIRSLEGVFGVVNTRFFSGKNILLVDDLLTTGATLLACLEVLKECGPRSLSVCTIGGLK